MDNIRDKNILIIGAPRTGKSSLARKISREYGYNLISIDDIVSGFKALPDADVYHKNNEEKTSECLAPFLQEYLKELSEGSNFYGGVKFVIEGTHFDFEKLMPFLDTEKYREKYEVIGLTFNELTSIEIFNNIKKYDTEDDWTYWSESDEALMGDCRFFVDRNKFFNEKFMQYNIKTFDTSFNREEVLEEICNIFFNKKSIEK